MLDRLPRHSERFGRDVEVDVRVIGIGESGLISALTPAKKVWKFWQWEKKDCRIELDTDPSLAKMNATGISECIKEEHSIIVKTQRPTNEVA